MTKGDDNRVFGPAIERAESLDGSEAAMASEAGELESGEPSLESDLLEFERLSFKAAEVGDLPQEEKSWWAKIWQRIKDNDQDLAKLAVTAFVKVVPEAAPFRSFADNLSAEYLGD